MSIPTSPLYAVTWHIVRSMLFPPMSTQAQYLAIKLSLAITAALIVFTIGLISLYIDRCGLGSLEVERRLYSIDFEWGYLIYVGLCSILVTAASFSVFRSLTLWLGSSPLFDSYMLFSKSLFCVACSFIVGFLVWSYASAHLIIYEQLCSVQYASMKDKLIIYVSCCTFGVALYVARLCISVIPIEDTRQTTNYAIMFDFAVRRITSGPVQMAMGTGRLTANTASGPFLLYQVSTFLRCQINSRLSTSGIILSALLLVIGIAFSIGLVQDGRYLWVVFVTAGLCFIGSEIWLAPYIVLDDRIRYSGERFYNMLSFLVAGYSRIVVIALLVIGLLVGSFATSYWIAALLFIIVIVRCLMKVAFFERAQLATRTYTGVAAIGGLLFLVLGPLSTIALLIAPVMFYRVAGRRTCPQ